MKTKVFMVVCVLAGCAVGAMRPVLKAQSFAPNPSAPRREQFCTYFGGIGNDSAARARATERINATLAQRGREGFELVGAPVMTVGKGGTAGATWDEILLCFRRPAAN